MPQVQTVTGPVDTAELGQVLMHEHVFVLSPDVQQNYPEEWGSEEERVRDAVAKLTELAGRGVRLVGVNVRDDRGAATSYLEEFGVTYPSLFDRPAVLAARLGRFAPDFPPYTLVVDGKGRVAARVFGVLPGDRPQAQADLLADVVQRATAS